MAWINQKKRVSLWLNGQNRVFKLTWPKNSQSNQQTNSFAIKWEEEENSVHIESLSHRGHIPIKIWIIIKQSQVYKNTDSQPASQYTRSKIEMWKIASRIVTLFFPKNMNQFRYYIMMYRSSAGLIRCVRSAHTYKYSSKCFICIKYTQHHQYYMLHSRLSYSNAQYFCFFSFKSNGFFSFFSSKVCLSLARGVYV